MQQLKKIFSALCVTLAVFSLESQDAKKIYDEYLASLTEMQQVSQVFLVNILGNSNYKAIEFDENKTPLVPGGCLFFNYNIGDTAENTIDFTNSIAEYCEKNNIPKPYLTIDQEGGYVNRLKTLTSKLPAAKTIAEEYTPKQSTMLYTMQGIQMKELGFHLNTAPVAEALLDSNKDFLDTRSYGKIPEAIAYSMASINGYKKSGISCAVKHFPGNNNTDPHSGLPEIHLSEHDVKEQLILPFYFALTAKPECVIMSLAKVSSIDKENPACLSEIWVEDILKKKLGFEGLIISDDIFMGAVSNLTTKEIAVKSILAGIHVIMLSDKYYAETARHLIMEAEKNTIFAEKLKEAERKVIDFKIKCGLLELVKENGGKTIIKEVPSSTYKSKENRVQNFYKAKRDSDNYEKK